MQSLSGSDMAPTSPCHTGGEMEEDVVSCRIHWRPVADKGRPFTEGTSDMLTVLKNQFGDTVGPQDVRVLRAMAHASGRKFYDEVADIVENVGEIEVWGEW
jgi:hypothetical protein